GVRAAEGARIGRTVGTARIIRVQAGIGPDRARVVAARGRRERPAMRARVRGSAGTAIVGPEASGAGAATGAPTVLPVGLATPPWRIGLAIARSGLVGTGAVGWLSGVLAILALAVGIAVAAMILVTGCVISGCRVAGPAGRRITIAARAVIIL